ncbi:DMT family transporter [Aliiroseovarius subalbicans]|uniref:DMT family transporter n=1 Tax=Aliiroseovarius subalbicans TaxID=2925840 RepID=UPI001F56BDFB|nr:DMT family transporter [Aliiroseovarius subalbicans]MCI2399528.1 DMT family transporter [Aliiroseovarius subalbicans]
MTTTNSALIMLAAGIGIPVLAALNAALGQRLGSPIGAGLILFVVAFLTTGAVFLVSGASLKGALSAPPHLFLAGTLVAFYVLTITWIAPTFGVGNAVFFVLIGQLLSAAAIDHFALFGASHHPLTLARSAGIAVMAAGVFLTQIAGRG